MSDETTGSIIGRITVKYPKPQKILGGHLSDIFFDCIKLTPTEHARLAAGAVGDLSFNTFHMAIGMAYTGVFFAGAVAGGKEVGIFTTDKDIYGPTVKGKKIILVDDVVVNGTRIKEAAAKVKELGGTVTGVACIVDRSRGNLKEFPIFSAYQYQ